MRLRRQPKSLRNKVALGTASAFTLLITLIWFQAQLGQWSDIDQENATASVSDAPFFSGFTDGLRDRLDDLSQIGDAWDELQVIVEGDGVLPVEVTEVPSSDTAAVVEESEVVTTVPPTSQPRVVQLVTVSASSSSATATSPSN
jgi:hypothetical protein